MLVILLLLAPDATEFGVPGLMSLKLRVDKTEATAKVQEQQIMALHQQFVASSSSRSSSNNHLSIVMDSLRHGSPTDLDAAALNVLANQVLAALQDDLRTTLGDPHLEVAVYLPVHAERVLRQLGKPAADVTDFAPDFGATGQAYARRGSIFISGEPVHNLEYGLSEAQQKFFADLQIVAATPIFDLRDMTRVLGVLTCASASAPPADTAELEQRWVLALVEREKLYAIFLQLFRFTD